MDVQVNGGTTNSGDSQLNRSGERDHSWKYLSPVITHSVKSEILYFFIVIPQLELILVYVTISNSRQSSRKSRYMLDGGRTEDNKNKKGFSVEGGTELNVLETCC